jgi:HEPN domain-containing protein
MPGKRFPPDDPREWLNRAKSNLAKAKIASEDSEIYLEDLCFDAQQAAEKAIKAVLISINVRFPYSHNLGQLLTLVEQAGLSVPNPVRQAAGLSDYAVQLRYPGFSEPVIWTEYEEAHATAEAVVRWAEAIVAQTNQQKDTDLPGEMPDNEEG